MRKLILQMQMSADGFVGADGLHSWQLWNWGSDNRWDEDLKRDFNAHFHSLDTILLSSRMAQEGYLTHWGKAAAQYPHDPFYAFAQQIIDVQKVVPSQRLTASRWDRTVVRNGGLAGVVGALKSEEGGNIGVFGGAGLASALIDAALVDEFQFYINPAVLGRGKRIFETAGFGRLALLGVKGYSCGMLVSRYAPRADSL